MVTVDFCLKSLGLLWFLFFWAMCLHKLGSNHDIIGIGCSVFDVPTMKVINTYNASFITSLNILLVIIHEEWGWSFYMMLRDVGRHRVVDMCGLWSYHVEWALLVPVVQVCSAEIVVWKRLHQLTIATASIQRGRSFSTAWCHYTRSAFTASNNIAIWHIR